MGVPNIKRNVETGQIFIAYWVHGVNVNRSSLLVPISAMGMQIISHYDTLWGGGWNMEISLQSTLVRRPGFTQFCNQAFNSSEWPLQFYSYKNLNGVITTLVDTQTNTYSFTPTAKTSIFTKTGAAGQTSFQRVGNILYMADGTTFTGTAYNGTIGAATPVGIAVPTVAPTFTLGTGFLDPSTGFTYGYSYDNSSTGQVSTMSPISSDVGDLNVQTVSEASVTVQVNSCNTAGSVAGSAGTVTFGTPNGNNFWVGAKVTLSGFSTKQMNGVYTITVISTGSFGASTAQWGPAATAPAVGQNANIQLTGLTGVTAVLSPITIPGAAAASPYVYTVSQSSTFAPTNAWAAVTPSPLVVTGPKGTPVYAQIQSGTPATGHFVCNATTGALTFASADAGKSIIVTYAITPVTGGKPVGFTIAGPSANNAFAAGTQTDITGYSIVDSVTVYRSQDADGTAGPWYFIATIPSNVTLTAATYAAQTNQTTYTFASTIAAGANNGFAGATGTGGATIAGFTNAGNNGHFDIVASSTASITCTNPSGVTETHAGTVNTGTWTYNDTGAVYGYPFDPTVPDGELDILIEAQTADENNPPPSLTNPLTNTGANAVTGTFNLITYAAGRLWGAVDNYLYFASGPDVTFGSPTESWNPANVFPLPGLITALEATPSGVLAFTSDDMFVVYGTNSSNFFIQPYQKHIGVASQNDVVMDGDVLYIYTNQGQIFSFTGELTEIGFDVAPILATTFPPATSYLTMHKSGEDVGLFVSDGSVNYMKYRPDLQCWSPLCQITNGVGCMKSIETSTSVYTLLAGQATGSGFIYGRNLNTWQDNINSTYTCGAVIGSLIVSPPGSTAVIKYLTLQYMKVGTAPTLSILANELATVAGVGPWMQLGAGVNDPPGLVTPTTMCQQRFYLSSAGVPIPMQMNHMMVKITFVAGNTDDELLTMGID